MNGSMEFFLRQRKSWVTSGVIGTMKYEFLLTLKEQNAVLLLLADGKYTNLLDGAKVDGKSMEAKPLRPIILKID
ncbi:MAG: hypothetical protein EAY75_15215 [Bacteroidetes bacterium]|nr:MAG: hypothetical protein EAY75_15215 [Bacteroidota bacterium]